MARLSARQIAGYAYAAGFRGTNLAIAVAVALAESGGRTDAHNTKNRDGSQDFGLWQINSVHGDLLSSGSWSNPADNARMAYAVWKGQGWHGWTTYNNGAYLAHLGIGNVAASNPGTVSGAAGATAGAQKKLPAGIAPPYLLPQYRKRDIAQWPQLKSVPNLPSRATPEVEANMRTFIRKVDAAVHDKTQGKIAGPRELPSYDLEHLDSLHGQQLGLAYLIEYNNWENIDSGITIPGKKTLNDTIDTIAGILGFATDAHNWYRAGLFLAGGGAMLFAAYKMSGATVKIPAVIPV